MSKLHFNPMQCIVDFHTKFELSPQPELGELPIDLGTFRKNFLLEEFAEMQHSWQQRDIIHFTDALVDLDYVLLGTAYLAGYTISAHRSDTLEWDLYEKANTFYFRNIYAAGLGPRLPSGQEMSLLVFQIATLIHQSLTVIDDKYFVDDNVVMRLHQIIWRVASRMRLPFVECWQEVQRANMSKVRAARPADSKRGSGFDVIKPEGWQPPAFDPIFATTHATAA